MLLPKHVVAKFSPHTTPFTAQQRMGNTLNLNLNVGRKVQEVELKSLLFV
jgi:hypothetical protein